MADLMSFSRANEVGPLGMCYLLAKPPTHRFHEFLPDTLKQFVQRIRETPMHPQGPFIPEGMSAGPSTHSLYTPTMSSTAPSSAQIPPPNPTAPASAGSSTPSLANATLKRKGGGGGETASPTTTNAEQSSSAAKRNPRKRGRTTGGGN